MPVGRECRVCGCSDVGERHVAREMMFGTREQHTYVRCSDCGCLQIEEIPQDLGRYYPEEYYSLSVVTDRPKGVRAWFARQHLRAAIGHRNPVGSVLFARDLVAPSPAVAVRSLRHLDGDTEARVLDVGCGAGALLRQMRMLGFERTKGIEPFNAGTITYDDGVTVEAASLADDRGTWDVVMFHHSFEHIPDQHRALNEAATVLSPAGKILVRIPLVSDAWYKYGVDWVQLDAPRHLYLHSVESFRRLAEHAGLRVDRVVYDSTKFQFWASELYRRDVALSEGGPELFSLRDMLRFERQARALNRVGRGDQAAFYLSI